MVGQQSLTLAFRKEAADAPEKELVEKRHAELRASSPRLSIEVPRRVHALVTARAARSIHKKIGPYVREALFGTLPDPDPSLPPLHALPDMPGSARLVVETTEQEHADIRVAAALSGFKTVKEYVLARVLPDTFGGGP